MDEQAQRLRSRKRAHPRPLIPNASHIQQQVEQHVGVTLKNQETVSVVCYSFTNFGLYLPMDGRRDMDIDMLHVDDRYNVNGHAEDDVHVQ